MTALKRALSRRKPALTIEQVERRLRDAIIQMIVHGGPTYAINRLEDYTVLLQHDTIFRQAAVELHEERRNSARS